MICDERMRLLVLDAKEKIEANRKDDTIVMPLFTDLHTEAPDSPEVDTLCALLAELKKELSPDAVIDLGDNPAMLGRNRHIQNDDLKQWFEALLTRIHESAGCPLLTVHGNHDAPGTDFFKPDFWNALTKHKYGNTDAVYGETGSYYYVDSDKADTRFVVLSVPHESDIEAEFPTPMWGFGTEQLDWLEQTALNTDKQVIILIHVPFFDEYRGSLETTHPVWTGERAAVSRIWSLCGWIDDVERASAILNRFAETTGRLVACLSGHTHTDSLRGGFEEQDGYRNPLACPQTVTESFRLPKQDGRIYGFSLDVMVWTPSERYLALYRIGDGEDRVILQGTEN